MPTTHSWHPVEQQACILLGNVSVCFTASQQHKNKSVSVLMCVCVSKAEFSLTCSWPPLIFPLILTLNELSPTLSNYIHPSIIKKHEGLLVRLIFWALYTHSWGRIAVIFFAPHLVWFHFPSL